VHCEYYRVALLIRKMGRAEALAVLERGDEWKPKQRQSVSIRRTDEQNSPIFDASLGGRIARAA
jgi:hypothetical protein